MDNLAHDFFPVVGELLRDIYDDFQLLSLDTQGACSYTALLTTTNGGVQSRKIIQVREAQFALDLNITNEATRVYGHLAPKTKLLAKKTQPLEGRETTFYYYQLDLIPGVPYSDLIPRQVVSNEETFSQQRVLVGHLARFFARSWHRAPAAPARCDGKVGSQIQTKLEKLCKQLPTLETRTVATWALENLDLLERIPVVLTHGDIVPSNIMVHPDTGILRGMVDWVEAEYLPFGLAFYGLEYLLGFSPTASARRDSMTDSSPFVYYDCASTLRAHFWATLLHKIPEMKQDVGLLKAVHVAKVIGTLLWFGFAWDAGAINRVVTSKRDPDVLVLLETFLSAELQAWEGLANTISTITVSASSSTASLPLSPVSTKVTSPVNSVAVNALT